MLKPLIFLSICVYYTAGTPKYLAPLFRQKRSEDTCLTTSDSKDPGAKCVFPFKYKGKTYTGCPPVLGNPGRTWCSTKTDSDGNHVSGGGNFGFCSSHCKSNAEMAKTSCKCQSFSSCSWSNNMINQIKGLARGSADHQVLSQKFQSQICNQKQKMVWCCDDGKPNSDLTGDLYDMEREDPVTRSVEEPGYYPAYQPLSTGAGCHIHWKESVIIEHKDIKTTVCTTIDVHTCWNKTIEECKFISIDVPFTEVVDVCVTQEKKVCQQHWACLDEGWTKDKDTDLCNNEVYKDSDNCVSIPEDICTQEERTFMRSETKKECKDIPYEDCSQKVPFRECETTHIREPVTHTENIPYKVCGSD